MMATDVSVVAPLEGWLHKFQYWFAKAWKDTGGSVIQDIRMRHKIREYWGSLLEVLVGG